MKIAVTVKTTDRIGEDSWRNRSETRVFDEKETVYSINKWIKEVDESASISSAIISNTVAPVDGEK